MTVVLKGLIILISIIILSTWHWVSLPGELGHFWNFLHQISKVAIGRNFFWVGLESYIFYIFFFTFQLIDSLWRKCVPHKNSTYWYMWYMQRWIKVTKNCSSSVEINETIIIIVLLNWWGLFSCLKKFHSIQIKYSMIQIKNYKFPAFDS